MLPTASHLTHSLSVAHRRWMHRADTASRALTSYPFRSSLQRFVVLASGAAFIAAGVSLTIWTGLGPGPLDVFNVAVNRATHLPLPVVVWLVAGTLMTVATLLGRRPGLGTLVGPLLTGPLLGLFVTTLSRFDAPHPVAAALGVHLVGVAMIGVGAGAFIVSGLGAGTGELLAGAAAARVGRSDALVRTAIETSIGVVGILIGGAAGLGTIVVMLTIGPAVRIGHARVQAVVAWAQVRRALRRELRTLHAASVAVG
jgi:uncharacterized membrane protein YczE